jgi:hypothetical protein
MEILNILVALVALVLPFVLAWVIVSHTDAKHPPKPVRKSRK